MINHYSTRKLWATAVLGIFFILFSAVPTKSNNEIATVNEVADDEPIIPILECIEDLGNGIFKATFGYDNPNNKSVTVPRGNSRIVWNGTARQLKVHNKFQPGVHESVLEAEFDTNTVEDGLTWVIRIPKKVSMEASADADSEQCEPIIGAIQNFNASPVSISQIDLSWEEPTSTEPFTYTLERSQTGTDPWTEIASGLPQTTTSFSDDGLDEFTEYTYRIAAGNNNATTGFTTTLARTNSDLSSADNFNGKNRDKIGPKLTSLAQGSAGTNPSEIIYQFDADFDVLVEIIPKKNPSTVAAIIDLLQTKYLRTDSKFILDPITYVNEDKNRIDVFFEVTRLEELNLEDIVNFVQPAFRPRFGTIGDTGVLYQGDSSQASLDVRKSFKTTRFNPSTGLVDTVFLDGGGQRLGVISNSFNTQPFSGSDSRYVVDQKNQDLPGPDNPFFPNPVAVLEEPPGQSSDEGRAMLQIVHDVAPGADLGFHTGLPTLNKFEEAVTDLSMAGYNLIIDDVTFLIENYFGQYGSVFDAVGDHLSRDSLNMYISSSGNFADQAIEGTLNFVPLPAGSNIYPDSVTGYIHDFGGGDLTLDIFANPGEYILGFQWDEPFSSVGDPTGAVNDLDMYVVDDSLLVEAGNNRINILGDALELLILSASGAKASNLVFTCECDTPPTNLKFRMIAFKISGDAPGAGLEFSEPISAPTVSGHAGFDLPRHITVGASFYGYYGTGAGPDLEPFSSLGTSLGQNKVDITGPDGGNINVLSTGSDIMFDSDVFNNFFGTSASAPAVAAAWALGLSAIPSWFPSGTPTGFFDDPSFATGNPVDEVTGLFLESATPVSNPDIGGAGLLRLEDALKGVAAQTPLLSDFIVEEGKVISVDTVDVTLLGDYFTSSSQVTLNGESVPTTFVSENELMVTIGPFSGDAGFVVTNAAPITENMTDGGDSNPLDLLDGRRAITIVAKDTTFTFGQDFDALEFGIEGLVGGETYESLGLPEVVLTSTTVGPYADVNNYRIDPSFAMALTLEQEDEFIVAFRPGVLSITSLPLTILVADTTAIYGDEPVVLINYIYNTTGISDNAAFLNFLKTEHESTFLTDTLESGIVNRFSAVVNRFSAVVNENPGRIDEIIDLLTNSNWLATETTIENRFSPVVNRFSAVVNYVPFDADQLLDFLDTPLIGNSGAIENRFSAVVNGEDLVTGLTSVFDPLENRFSPVVNRFSAVVNRFSAVVNVPLGDEDDETDLMQTLALVDGEDGDNTEFDTVAVYSINVITGLDVTLTNADRHFMVSGAAMSPVFTNCIVNYEPGLLTVDPAPITIHLDEIGPTTYAEPVVFSSTVTGNTAYGDTLTIDYFLNPVSVSITPISAGSYIVEQLASTSDSTGTDNSSNYDFTILNGPLVVNSRPLAITLDDPGEVGYGDPVVFSSTLSGTLAPGDSLDIAYNFNPVPVSTDPISVGSFSIEQSLEITDSTGASNNVNYDLLVTDDSLIVNPATLTIYTEDLLIEEGANLPPSGDINSTITGIIPGESESDVFPPSGPVFNYSSPEYEMIGREAGTYVLLTTVTPDPENYTVVYDGAQLFVNLSSGKKIRVYLDCIADNKGQGDYPFTAYFSYENDNDVSIFIQPMSPDNLLIGTSFDPSSLPFEFFSGSHQFAVPFVGELRWQVATFGSAHNTSQQVDSDNLKGQRCKGNDIINGRTAGPESGPEDQSIFNAEEVQFYPNPVSDHLTVRVNKNFSNHDFELYDSQGIRHSVTAVIDPIQSTVEFDLSNFETGLYLLKLNIEGTTAIIRILRQ